MVACMGYELTTDLDFDSNNDGSVTAADDFFANFPWADSGAAAFTTTISGVFEGDGWVPIGYAIGGYGGVLDGGGHVIRNLYIDAAAQYVGLFGSLTSDAVVRNLGLLEADLNNTKVDSTWTGGLVGQSSGDIIAVCFDGSVNSVNNSGVTGAGGVAGENIGRIIASYSTGDIATTDGPIGGLAGQNDNQVIASYSTASVTATPADATKSHPGGLIGLADSAGDRTPTVTNSYFDTDASGQTSSAGGDGKTARELQTPTGYAGIYADWDDIDLDGDPATVDENDFWRFGLPGQYPVLWWEAAEVEAGTTDYDSDNDGLIEVGSLAQLDALRWDLNGDGAADTNDGVVPHGAAYPDALKGMGCPDSGSESGCKGYELTANLDFDTDGSGGTHTAAGDDYWNDGLGWLPLDAYNAVFEGNRYEIDNLFVKRDTDPNKIPDAGLFGALHANAEVRNLGIGEARVAGDSGTGNAGVLAGSNAGLITASYFVNTGTLSGFTAGGLVGKNTGTITSSYAGTGLVSPGGAGGGLVGENSASGVIIAAHASTVVVRATTGVAGGLAGKNDGVITASYYNGTVTVGSLTGDGFVGANAGTITDSYFQQRGTGTGVGTGSAEGVTGLTDVELQAPTGYTGIYANWNVDLDGDGTTDDPWRFLTSADYPALSWAVAPRVLASPGKLALNEFGAGNSATYQVSLSAAPSGEVTVAVSSGDTTVAVSSGDTTVATVSPASLTFDEFDFADPQTVTVTAVNDSVFTTGRTTAIGNAASGGGYDNLSATVGISVTDDDVRSIVLSKNAVTVTEATGAANTATYGVKLATQPTASVTVNVASGDTDIATVSPATLTFTTANWNTNQTVTVTGVNDSTNNDGRTTNASNSGKGGGYDGLVSYVEVSLTDDDRGIVLSETSLSVTEASGSNHTATYTVALATAPVAGVTVGITSSPAGIVTVSPASLSFTPGNSSVAQTVTVTGAWTTTWISSRRASAPSSATPQQPAANPPTTESAPTCR